MIPLNKIYHPKNELEYVTKSILSERQSGDSEFTGICNTLLKKCLYNRAFPLLTTSCTHSLEMSALILKLKPGDEVIMPSYTFVSTANAFLMRGARIIFCDSQKQNPNMDIDHVRSLITNKTKVIVPVHYAGISCDMDQLISMSKGLDIRIVEDNAHGMGAYYKDIPLGTIGDLGCLSFHDTKNISCGEGGALIINDESLINHAEIIREKGTDRSSFIRGEVDKYGWKKLGSSYLLSDILAAKLVSQFEDLDYITEKRKTLWDYYHNNLFPLEKKGIIKLPDVPKYANHCGHIFYVICEDIKVRDSLINHFRLAGIQTAFHYQSLHKSDYFSDKYQGEDLINSDRYSDCLLRLPLYPDLQNDEIDSVIETLFSY